MKYIYVVLFSLFTFTLNAQRVFISDNVLDFNATIFQETDPNLKTSWNVYMTDNINPNIAGNWKQMKTQDSAVFVFKSVNDRQAAHFTYRIIEDSTRTSFRYSGSKSDFFDLVSYSFVDDIEQANLVICLTSNKWIANDVIYKSPKPFNINKAHWHVIDQGGDIKVFITTNRTIADRLVYFTNNPLEAQIR